MAKKNKKRGYRSNKYTTSYATRKTPISQSNMLLQKLSPIKYSRPKIIVPRKVALKNIKKERLIPRRKRIANDRRYWQPPTSPNDRYGPKNQRIRLYLAANTIKSRTKETTRLKFSQPKLVEICQRRSVRREVLFKLGKAGKGRGIKTPKNLNQFSKIRC